jgi:Cys-rich four helix bundle protein (predicted Tat secretion target)
LKSAVRRIGNFAAAGFLQREILMDRRELLLGGMALAGAAMVGNAQAAEHDMMMHEHHHGASTNAALANAASDCVQKAQVCLDHCLGMLGERDAKDMAACAKTTNQVLAICAALQQFANQNSKSLAKLATVAMDVCKQCEDECKKVADVSDACKACGESCAACYKECRKIAA